MADSHPDILRALSRPQRRVARKIVRIGERRGESRRKINANLAIGLVESNLRNLRYGHADSLGYRQERPSVGYKNPNNTRAAINRAYDEMDQLDRGQSPGELAADIQRPREDLRGRYAEEMDQARAIRRALQGGRGAGTAGLVLPGRQQTKVSSRMETIPGQSFAADRAAARQDLLLGGDINLKSLLAYKTKVNSLKDIPDRKVRGDLQVQRTHGPAVKVPGTQGLTAPADIGSRKWGGSRAAGRSLVKAAGLPVVSKKRSTQNTASGGVSDHWDQNKDSFAWDLGVTGEAGTRAARKLARMLGEQWEGGSWLNVTKTIGGVKYRFQIGWNVPDHYDHIHLGVDRVDTPG